MNHEPVEAVSDRRAGRAARLVVGSEHEVVDEELRAPSEEIRQRSATLVCLESIRLVDPNPRQLLPSPRELVAVSRQLLLRLEQLEPCCEPLFTCADDVCRHRPTSLRRIPWSFRSAFSAFAVLVVSAKPEVRLVTALRCAIEPRVHAPERV